jgi:hypothetical protein
MPSTSYEDRVLQIIQAANKDSRIQPWMEEMEDVINIHADDDTEETVTTGGPCDVLHLFFPAS